jgi:hypothetical protein
MDELSRLRTLMAQAHALETFFGARLDRVDPRLLRMASIAQPAWLRGQKTMPDLPRFNPAIAGSGVSFDIGQMHPLRLAVRMHWVVDTLDGEWCASKNHLFLISDTDVVHYRLRWDD